MSKVASRLTAFSKLVEQTSTRPTSLLTRRCFLSCKSEVQAFQKLHRRQLSSLRSSQRPQLVEKRGPIQKPSRRNIFIQTETTPNNDALKFKPNQRVLPESFPSPFVEYLTPRSTLMPPYTSQLAAQLLNVDGVTSIFYGADYITVTKDPSTAWAHIKPEVFSLITETITSGQPVVTISEVKSGQETEAEADTLAYNEEDSEVVGMIKELLDTRIRPAIQEDGGDIDFKGFENGQVKLKLRGACRTCDSSTVTLRNGIESMLMHYIEEVKGVQQVLDEEEELSLREFEKFEEKLKMQREKREAAEEAAATR